MNPTTLTDPPVPQWRSSQAAIAILAPLLAGLASILLTGACYGVIRLLHLPDEVAAQTMLPINLSLAAAGGGGSVGGAIGLVKRGLKLTDARIENQAAEAQLAIPLLDAGDEIEVDSQ